MAKQILGKVVPIAKGEYNSSTQYEILDIVTHNGSSYIAKTNVKGQTPTNTTYWQLLAKVGDKPVYGVDYLTEQEMNAIVQDIINDSTNTFNQNVTAKTNEFNTNATSKTNAFNQNAENKETTFNNNASAKTSTFNTNASDKTSDFNSNATAKTTAFNTNAQNKTNDFNTNATSSTDDFDRNATAKTEAYNSNASDKLSAYNSNAESKLSSYNTNASSKISAYDENHATKMGAYNTNATAKQDTYDENHTLKLGEYNTNATAKTTAFNDNYQEKLDDFNSHVEDYDKRITTNSNRIQHIETDLFDSGNATGSSITLNDSTLAEFIDVKEDGVCEQVTTTGKNLFDTSLLPITKNGVTLSLNDKYEIVVNGTPDIDSGYINFPIGNSSTSEVGTYTISVIKKIVGIGIVTGMGSGNLNLSMAETTKMKTYNFTNTTLITPQINISHDVGTLNNVVIKVQLEKNDTETEFESFTEKQPSPSPDYQQPISVLSGTHNVVVTGKNLFDTSLLPITKNGVTISKNNNGDIVIDGTPNINDGFITFQVGNSNTVESGTYTVSVTNKITGIGIVTGMGSGTINLTRADTVKTKTSTFNNFTSINPAILINYDVGTLNNFVLNPQIEKDSTFTTYEPFVGTTTEIEIPTGQFAAKINNTCKDQIRIAYNEEDGEYHAYLDKRITKNVLDGSDDESWGFQGTNNYGLANFLLQLESNYPNNQNLINSQICNYFSKQNTIFSETQNEGFLPAYTPDTQILTAYFRIKTITASSLSEFKTWLSTHNIQLYYPLATPTTIDLGVIDMPTTYYPITNIFTDSELNPVLEVNYYRDFKTTIQTMQNYITTLQSNYLSLDQRVTALENTNTQSNVASVESEGE